MKNLLNAVFSTLLITAPALAQDSLSPQMPQTRAGTGETIIDSKGAHIGTLIGPSGADHIAVAERLIGNQWVQFTVNAAGFYPSYPSLQTTPSDNPILFKSTDCSGQGYMLAVDLPTRAQVVVSGTPNQDGAFNSAILYYAGQPFSFVSVRSSKDFPNSSICRPQGGGGAIMGPVKTFSLPTFVPPFAIR